MLVDKDVYIPKPRLPRSGLASSCSCFCKTARLCALRVLGISVFEGKGFQLGVSVFEGNGFQMVEAVSGSYGRQSVGAQGCAMLGTTRRSTPLSSKVDSPHPINFRVLCGARLATLPSEFGGNGTLVLHRVGA